jgi:hypothetical protein
MSSTQVNQQPSAVTQLSPAHAVSVLGSGGDFRAILTKLYSQPQQMIKEYADDSTETMEINGFGVLDKSKPAASLAIGTILNQLDAQLSTLLSGIEFALKTLPQKADNLWS